MDSALNLVVNCAARKRASTSLLSLCSLGPGSCEERFIRWTELLSSQTANKSSAADLYCGDYWTVVRKCAASHSPQVSLFIASAGYGLVHSSEQLHSYSATFARGLADSIPHKNASSEINQKWWNFLSRWRRTTGCNPSSISDLALREPKKPILATLSGDYFEALYADLVTARDALFDPQLLIILGAGIKNPKELRDHLLPMDARAEHTLGGARGSLNARMALHLLENFQPRDFRVSNLRPYLENFLSEQPSIRSFDRSRMTDEEVISFIRSESEGVSSISFSTLLRKLRNQGKACEYKRFRALFHSVNSSTPNTAVAT
jgi:hypothetical protein